MALAHARAFSSKEGKTMPIADIVSYAFILAAILAATRFSRGSLSWKDAAVISVVFVFALVVSRWILIPYFDQSS